jgi:hypothetical protein
MAFSSGPFHGRQLSQESDIALVQDEDLDYSVGFNKALSVSTPMLSPGGLFSKSKLVPTIRNWPHKPKTLRKSSVKVALSVLLDTVLVLVPLPFLALAVTVAVKNRRPVVESEWDRLKTATRLVRHPRLQSSM